MLGNPCVETQQSTSFVLHETFTTSYTQPPHNQQSLIITIIPLLIHLLVLAAIFLPHNNADNQTRTTNFKTRLVEQSSLNTEITPGSVEDKALGMLLGSAIDKALGAPTEFATDLTA